MDYLSVIESHESGKYEGNPRWVSISPEACLVFIHVPCMQIGDPSPLILPRSCILSELYLKTWTRMIRPLVDLFKKADPESCNISYIFDPRLIARRGEKQKSGWYKLEFPILRGGIRQLDQVATRRKARVLDQWSHRGEEMTKER